MTVVATVRRHRNLGECLVNVHWDSAVAYLHFNVLSVNCMGFSKARAPGDRRPRQGQRSHDGSAIGDGNYKVGLSAGAKVRTDALGKVLHAEFIRYAEHGLADATPPFADASDGDAPRVLVRVD